MVESDQSGQMKKTIAEYCFKNLTTFIKSNGKQMVTPPKSFDEFKYPLFVTWLKNGQLRGCIGTFADDQPLGQTLQRYSLIAAVQDTRFEPISEDEFSALRVEISLLNTFEQIQDPLDWNVGTHGIEIEFSDPSNKQKVYRGTFLPNVAPEQGWNQEETLEHLCSKAGFRGGFSKV
jgi:uncharacterized protein (TIGR00296 family)